MTEADRPRWLATADDLARAIVARAAPIRFAVASDPQEIEAVYRLRHRTVVDLGWLKDSEAPDGLERDEYDDGAIHVAAWDGEALAGTLRLVEPRAGRPLPVEAAYGIVVEPRGRVMGAGRLIVAPDHRGGGHAVLGGLAATAWLCMRERGYEWAAGTATPEMLSLFRRLGFEVDVLGEAMDYWGESRYPIRMGAADPGRW